MSKSSHNHLYYLDALFDFHLGGYPIGKLARSASEMSTLFAFMGDEFDQILLDVELPDDFLCYLHSIGIKLLQKFDKQKTESPLTGVAWGWDTYSYERLLKTGAKCDIPDLEIIKDVNSRKFHSQISDECCLGIPGSSYCGSSDFYLEYLKKVRELPIVVKPSFGGSGFGFRIIQNEEQGKNICKDIETLMQHGGIVVEPWCKRLYDFSTSITIMKNGDIGPMRHQRSISNMHGAFIGIYMAPDDLVIEKYAPVQERAVREAAKKLFSHGYFGPAGFDSFAYVDKSNVEKVAPVIEINARHSMSDVAHAIRNKHAPQKWCFFRLISHRRCNLPETYQKWVELLKDDHFDPAIQEGVILATPLRLTHNNALVQPSRSGFFIAANSEQELFERDERLRSVLETGGKK